MDLEITDEKVWKDKTIFVENNLTVSSTGNLNLNNVTLIFNNTQSTNITFRVEDGGKLIMDNSRLWNFGTDEFNPGLEIYSDDVVIKNCEFNDSFAGVTLHNVANIRIKECNFFDNIYGILFKNCNDIQLLGCVLRNNSENALRLENSGTDDEIELVNSTITHEKQSNSSFAVVLNNSNLKMVNVTSSDAFEEIVELDEASELLICRYKNFHIVNKKNAGLEGVDISIKDDNGNFVRNYTTNYTGQLNWIILKQKQFSGKNKILNYSIYTITPSKKGYIKKDYPFSISSTEPTTTVITMEKSEKDTEDEFTRTLYMFCICGIVVFLVFIIFMAINVRIVKKRLNASGIKSLDSIASKPGGLGPGGEIITCSECGAQVTSDVKFCPHCGEYFEGEEFTCPGCSAVVKEDAYSCSKCGRIFEKDTKREGAIPKSGAGKEDRAGSEKTEKRYCSECGGLVTDQEDRCPGCGLLFESGSEEKSSTKLKGTTERHSEALKTIGNDYKKEKKVPEHLSSLKDTKKRARKITEEEEADLKKKDIQKSDQKSDNIYMCSVCGEEISDDTKKCPKCGIEFE
jgi:parallel beta-helix repeat protein